MRYAIERMEAALRDAEKTLARATEYVEDEKRNSRGKEYFESVQLNLSLWKSRVAQCKKALKILKEQ